MPSSNDPSLVVNPGAGRSPASTVPAGALIPPGGGGGGGPILATDVNYSGDGNWVDGTPNPGTNVDAQLTKIIGDLTNDSDSTTDQHSGADRVSARTTVAEFIDSSTIDGTSIQALIEAFVTALTNDSASTTDHHSGADRVSARQTVAAFADSTTINGISIQALIEAFVTALSSTTLNHAGSDKVAARITVAEFANSNTASGASVQALVENVIAQLGTNVEASGTAATLTVSSSLDTVTIAGLSGITSDLNNQYITISGSGTPANNGEFQLNYVNGVSVTIPYNSTFVTDAGPLTWSVTPNNASGGRLVGAGASTTNFADGYPALSPSSLQGLIENVISLLAQDNRTSGTGAVVTANETGGGVSASITVSGGTVTVSGLGGGTINSLLIGQQIVISNASHGGNNGTFLITGLGAVLPASSVTITNGSAITDPNNGNIEWSVSPVILTGLSGFGPTSVGRWIILYGSVIPQNNGSFQVTAFHDATSVYINAQNAVTDTSSMFYSMDTSGKARLGSSRIAPRFADGVTQALVSPGTSLSNVLDNLVYLLSNSLGSSGNTGSLTISTTGGTLSGTFGVVNGSTTVTTTANQVFLFFPAGIIFAAQSTVLYAVTAFTWNGSTGTITLGTAYTGTTNTATTAHLGLLTFSGLTGIQRNFVGQQVIFQNVSAPNSFVGIIASYINSTSVTLFPTGANITDPLNTVIAWYLYASASAGANMIGASPTISTWANGFNFSPAPPGNLTGTFGVTSGLTTVTTTSNQETFLFAGSNILFSGGPPLVVYTVASVGSGSITLTSPYQGTTNGAVDASLFQFSVQQGFETIVDSLGGAGGSEGAFLVGAQSIGASVPQYSLAQGSVGTQLSSLVRQLNNQFNVRAIGTTWTLTSTWSVIQHHTASASTTSTFSSANTAGNILTATLFYHAASLPSMTISDTAQNTWVLASNEFNVTAGYGLAVYYCLSANASASNTVSFSGISPATDRNCVQLSEFASGNGIGSINSALYVDQSTGTSTTTGLTVLVNSNNGLTFAAVNLNQSTTGTVGAGLTQLSNHVSSGAGDVSIITATPTGPPLGVFEPGINNAIFVSGTSVSWASVGVVFISTPTLDADGTVNEYISFTLPTQFQLTPSGQNTGRRIYLTLGLAFPTDGVVLLPFGIETINGLAAPYTLPTADGHYMLQCNGTGWQIFSC